MRSLPPAGSLRRMNLTRQTQHDRARAQMTPVAQVAAVDLRDVVKSFHTAGKMLDQLQAALRVSASRRRRPLLRWPEGSACRSALEMDEYRTRCARSVKALSWTDRYGDWPEMGPLHGPARAIRWRLCSGFGVDVRATPNRSCVCETCLLRLSRIRRTLHGPMPSRVRTSSNTNWGFLQRVRSRRFVRS